MARVSSSSPTVVRAPARADTPVARDETPAAAASPDAFVPASLDADADFLKLVSAGAAEEKLSRLEHSPFVFFRGTAALFFKRLEGVDADKQRTLIAGDVHPENFGIMESGAGKLSFGIDDFDEAALAPFSWDLRRGATGFALLASSLGKSDAERDSVVAAFVSGYRRGVRAAAKGDKEDRPLLTPKRPPAVVARLMKSSKKRRRTRFLERYTEAGAFKTRTDLEPMPARVAEMQKVVDRYRRSLGGDAPADKAFYKVKDVAVRTGAGTASLGLKRYYLLLEGDKKSDRDDVILELKESVPSTLVAMGGSPLHARYSTGAQANRAAHIMRAGEDPLYGQVLHEGKSFLVRERSPRVVDPDFSSMSQSDLRKYAAGCGASVAISHARYGKADDRIAPQMTKAFTKELIDFGKRAADQATADHARFVALRG